MRVMAVDHGNARAGLAVCDPSETIVSPIDVVEPPEAAAVARIAAEREVERIVVGLPVGLSGSEGEQARIVRSFADELSAIAGPPVELYDERLTTRMAEASARGGARSAPDSLAAAHLLEAFLASRSAPAGDAAAAEGEGR